MNEKLCALKTLLKAVATLDESLRAEYGLTLTEAICVCSIRGGTTGAVELGEEASLSPSRLSRVLGGLESKGVVVRTRRSDDRRAWDVGLSADGAALADRLRSGSIAIPEILLAAIGGKE